MNYRAKTIPAADDHQINLRSWRPTTTTLEKGVIVIAHGLAEHIDRYDELASFLAGKGYHVAGANHRGHGQSAMDEDELGHLPEGGWRLMIEDLHHILMHVKTSHPDLPLILLGHSMGSFISLRLTQLYGELLDGLILSGSNYAPPLQFLALKQIARVERYRHGPGAKSRLIDKLAFGAFNKQFSPSRTEFDWLSRDHQRVDEYCNDPLCGEMSSNQLWLELLQGLADTFRKQSFGRIPDPLAVYLVCGNKDPVGANSKGVRKLARVLRATGTDELDLMVYPQGRHEMFNETNREEVFQDIITWLEKTGP